MENDGCSLWVHFTLCDPHVNVKCYCSFPIHAAGLGVMGFPSKINKQTTKKEQCILQWEKRQGCVHSQWSWKGGLSSFSTKNK